MPSQSMIEKSDGAFLPRTNDFRDGLRDLLSRKQTPMPLVPDTTFPQE